MKNKFVNLNLYSFLFEALKIAGGEKLSNEIISKFQSLKTKKGKEFFTFPAGEVLNLDSSDILNGSVLLNYLNFEGNSKLPENIASEFDYEKRKFKDEFLSRHKDYINNKEIVLAVNFKKNVSLRHDDAAGGASKAIYKGIGGGNSVLQITINPDHVKSYIINHELQHITQNINSLSLLYAKKLKDPKIIDISSLEINKQAPNLYGMGSEKTGATQHNLIGLDKYASSDEQKKKNLQSVIQDYHQDNLNPNINKINYLSSDEEYETYKANFLDSIEEFVFTDNFQYFEPIFNGETVDLKKYPAFNGLNISSRPITSLNDFAVLLIKDGVQNTQIFNKNPSNDHYRFVKIMLRIKPKEFLKDTTNDLTNILRNKANELGYYKSADTDQQMTQIRNTNKRRGNPSPRTQTRKQKSPDLFDPNVSFWNRLKRFPQQYKQLSGAQDRLNQLVASTPRPTNRPTVQTESTKLSEILYDKK